MEASNFVVAGWRVETCFGHKLVTRLFRTYFHPTLVFALIYSCPDHQEFAVLQGQINADKVSIT